MRRSPISLILAAAVWLMLSAGGVAAQDVARWQGFYVGAHAGYATGEWSFDLSKSSGDMIYNDPFGSGDHKIDAQAAFGGIAAGLNKQYGSIVVGLEVDGSFTDLSSSERFQTLPGHACGPVSCTAWDVSAKLDAFGTARGRLGYVAGPFLFYATGGVAFAQVETTYGAEDISTGKDIHMMRVSDKSNHIGWAAGGGIEWAMTEQLSIKADYIYVDLGSVDYDPTGTTSPTSTTPWHEKVSADLQFHTVRIGVNYKFGD
ncbi:MAG: outer membrane protein [Bacteroidota bacterium]